jgi:hypothetical protein
LELIAVLERFGKLPTTKLSTCCIDTQMVRFLTKDRCNVCGIFSTYSLVVEKQGLPRCAVTLVHGTIPRVGPIVFFRKQQWMDSQSRFCGEISTRLGLGPIWLPFTWSGENSHAARIKAGRELAGVLRENLARYPYIPHYVIAHSHGGNVALYALKFLSEQQLGRIAGVVTLGTPFIWCSMRDVTAIQETLIRCMKYGPLVWLASFIAACVWLESLFSFIGLFSLGMGVMGVILWRVVRKHFMDPWDQTAEELETSLDTGVPPAPLLCLTVHRDEAKGWIRIWELSGRLLFGHEYMGILDGIIGLLADFRSSFAFLQFGPQAGLALLVYSLIGTIACWGLGLFLFLLIFCWSALTISSPWGYGEPWFLRWVVAVTTRAAPRTRSGREDWIYGRFPILNLNDRNSACSYVMQKFKSPLGSFNHGWLHGDTKVATSAATWILNQMQQGSVLGAYWSRRK